MLGNLDARRDRGFACSYVEEMWLMLQQKSTRLCDRHRPLRFKSFWSGFSTNWNSGTNA